MAGRAGSGPGKRAARPGPSARPGRRTSARAGRSNTASGIASGAAAGKSRTPTPPGVKQPAPAEPATVRLLPSWMSTSSVRSRRILMLATVFVMLAVILFPTMRAYVAQQSQIAALRDQVAEQQAEVADLTKEQARWKDDAYVVQQARERLKFVKVGETSYTVIDSDPEVTSDPTLASAPGAGQRAWYGRLWSSLSVADATAP